MKFLKNNKGFTLIELLVVVAIIGILSSVVLTSLNTARMKARDTKRLSDLAQIRNAIELFYDANGYYPSAYGCGGWDCNGYAYSYLPTYWDNLQSQLAPYLKPLPVDPLNTGGCPPWALGCYTYAYGNVGRNTYPAQYDLTAQLEDPSSPYRCAVRGWKFYFNDTDWCGYYTGQIYEASLD